MKFFVAALALVAAASAFPQNKEYAVVRQTQEISPEGSYNYNYETENGIQAAESGSLQAVGPKGEAAIVAQGNYQYSAPDGTPVALSYTADENGYHPSGNILPVPPPVPEQIQRALEYIAAHPPKPENK